MIPLPLNTGRYSGHHGDDEDKAGSAYMLLVTVRVGLIVSMLAPCNHTAGLSGFSLLLDVVHY